MAWLPFLLQKDFSSVPDDELDELMRNIKALSKRLAAHINRRNEKSDKINLPDLRRTLRKNMRRGGELLEIAFRKPKKNRTKLVVICDVSKSMDLYSAFLLQFMYAFQQVYKRIETFAFSTSLQHVTSLLKQNDFKEAMQLISSENRHWSGGTRIGESLHSFVNNYSKTFLDKRSIVIILSDGWDTGNISLLQQSMETIHCFNFPSVTCRNASVTTRTALLNSGRSCASSGGTPTVGGMQSRTSYAICPGPLLKIHTRSLR